MSKIRSLQTEIDACYLYQKLAEKEKDSNIANVFTQMAEIEYSHAEAFAKKLNIPTDNLIQPSWRAKTIHLIGRVFGYDYMLGALMDTEKKLSNATIKAKEQHNLKLTGGEANHVKILWSILENDKEVSGAQHDKFEKRHRTVGGNAIRAAVLGGNDGLVSNFSLIMGVAGATGGNKAVLLAGIAGLLAGALSMALGEWISVKSSQELYENQMAVEMDELLLNPEGEQREIALIYIAKGIPEEQAYKMAADLMKDMDKAHEVLVKEELGINPDELEGSAMEAAMYSFMLFSIGAIIPLAPFFFSSGLHAIIASVISSAIGLFIIGGAITLFTGKNLLYSGFRQVVFGIAAATVTYGIGHLIGVAIG